VSWHARNLLRLRAWLDAVTYRDWPYAEGAHPAQVVDQAHRLRSTAAYLIADGCDAPRVLFFGNDLGVAGAPE
jgi:hypothetical protein